MRVVVAPQEFKGSLTARAAARAIASGIARALPDATIETVPLADGGPGTVEALVEATAGRYHDAAVHDPLGRAIRARWGSLGDAKTAVVEMAAASGLTLLSAGERDPRVASTRGTGELLRAALDADFRSIIVGVGGSATNDAGAGAAAELGARLLDGEGRDLEPGGAALARLAHVDASGLDPRLKSCAVTVATDVRNPLCGPDGASLVYGPQKGASPAVARELDAALARFADVIARDLGIDIRDVPGAGAAGGLAAGLIAFCGAAVRPGFDVVAEAVGLEERVSRADVVVTGEGRLDRQSAFGKTTARVAELARKHGKRVVAVVGGVGDEEARALFDAVFALAPDLADQREAMARAEDLVTEASMRAGRGLAG